MSDSWPLNYGSWFFRKIDAITSTRRVVYFVIVVFLAIFLFILNFRNLRRLTSYLSGVTTPDVATLGLINLDVTMLDVSILWVITLDVSTLGVTTLGVTTIDVTTLDISTVGVITLDVTTPDLCYFINLILQNCMQCCIVCSSVASLYKLWYA